MTDEFIMIILAMLGCIGLGVFFGWVLWGQDVKYYKNLSESYKEKLTSPEIKEAIIRKRIKDAINNSLLNNGKNVVNKLHEKNTDFGDKEYREECELYKKEFCE